MSRRAVRPCPIALSPAQIPALRSADVRTLILRVRRSPRKLGVVAAVSARIEAGLDDNGWMFGLRDDAACLAAIISANSDDHGRHDRVAATHYRFARQKKSVAEAAMQVDYMGACI